MMVVRRSIVLVLLFTTVLTASPSFARADEDFRQIAIGLLTSELPSQWAQAAGRITRGPIRHTSEIEYDYSKPEPGKHDKVRIIVKRQSDDRICLTEQVAGLTKIDQDCQGLNRRYYYELKKSKLGSPWLLTRVHGLELVEKNSFKTGRGDDLVETVDSTLQSVVQVMMIDGFKSLDAIPALEGFAVKDCKYDRVAGRANICFSFLMTPGNLKYRVVSECDLEVQIAALPSYKLVQKYSASNPSVTALHTWRQSWDKKGDGYRGEVVLDSTRTEGGQPSTSSYKAAVELQLSRIPESEFDLAAFGLPEPPGFVPPSTPMYVWLLGISACGFALFALFRFVASRRVAS